ncbi:MAG: hypothetical protein PHY14_04555 [Candidatus Gracilibacteria bacterium]|nr:hypothetical protein [Candidatus Gracilibacteria bacterium]
MRTSTLLSSILGYTKKLFRNAIFQILSLIVALGSIGITYAAWQTINSSEGAAGQPVTQTLIQKIINNLNDLNTKLQAINPSGTTLSGSSICIGADCKTVWPSSTPAGTIIAGCSDTPLMGAACWGGASKQYGPTSTCPIGSTFRKLSGAGDSSYDYSFICVKN